MKRVNYVLLVVLSLIHSVAFATADVGTGQPENTDATFDLLAWMLSWLPF